MVRLGIESGEKGEKGEKENDVTIRGEFLSGTHLVSYFHFLRQMISFLPLTEKLRTCRLRAHRAFPSVLLINS